MTTVCNFGTFWVHSMLKIWPKVLILAYDCNSKMYPQSLMSMTNVISDQRGKIRNTPRSTAFSIFTIIQGTDMALSFHRGNSFVWISLSVQQPFVLLRATSGSKIRCKASLALCHSQRSVGDIHNFHCQVTLHQWHRIVTHYLQANGKNWQPKHQSILLPYGQRYQFRFVFSTFLVHFLLSKTATQPLLYWLVFPEPNKRGLPDLKLRFAGTWM